MQNKINRTEINYLLIEQFMNYMALGIIVNGNLPKLIQGKTIFGSPEGKPHGYENQEAKLRTV